jgi:hypothetical protein
MFDVKGEPANKEVCSKIKYQLKRFLDHTDNIVKIK